MAMDPDGDFTVVWDSAQDGGAATSNDSYGDDGVYAQRYLADRTPLGAEFRVNTYTTGSQYQSALAMNDEGRFVVTWVSYSHHNQGMDFDIYAKPYDALGHVH